ncbi:MAG: PSD1 domain-containing protein [Candidatus Saccharimonas sp.]|nr:PSD1 domain-containing protein [Planctomycetaceae bacterium]
MTHRFAIVLVLTVACSTTSPAADQPSLPPAASRDIDFVRDIQPIFRTRCHSCHDGKKQRGELRLDVKSAALKGGESHAPAIVPGKSADSPLVRFVAGLEEGMLMPPEGERLSAEQIGLLRAWIDQGAKWPDEASAKEESHWSFRPVTRPEVPSVSREAAAWLRNPVDAFVASKLEEPLTLTLSPQSRGEGTGKRITASPEADRVTLIRRLNFDLLGLPPAPDEVAEFVADARPDAYERLVDRLLASPHFGERWARHWLDVVRFAESDGFETNQPRPNAWPYRDYVIRAFNEDKPFEQFVTEQLAGDVLGVDEATGFIVGGAWDRVKSPDPGLTAQQRADELHDMVSTTGSAFLGLTVGCARCHNHKFDPISQTDYYALKAVFAGVQHGERSLPRSDTEQRRQQLVRVKVELDEVERALWAFEPLAVAAKQPAVRRGSPDPAETPDRRSPLRAAVQRRTNIDRFAPTLTKFVRFTIDETNNGSQPCLDEVEVFTTEAKPRNVALAAHGTKVTSSSDLPGYEIHQLKHVNDGRYGNSASWISNEAGRGWVLFEFPEAVEIDRVLWSRDRPADGKFSDRIATKYRIEIGMSADALHVVATADDRQPIGDPTTPQPTRVVVNEQDQREAERLTARQASLNETLRQLTMLSQVYAGRFVAPEPTHRFHRGDPLQPKEPVAPASLASFGQTWTLPLDALEASRRQQLAKWITDPQHPLTARVLVNRLWHFHFGQGLVTTPSDFGRNGALPSHPELLEWLASEAGQGDKGTRRQGETNNTNFDFSPLVPLSPCPPLSPKRLHRLLVTSATYRQSSAARADAMQADAGTRLLWRYPPRRLEAEPLRDAILAVCGNLDDRMGGPGFDLFEPNTNYVKVYNSKKEFGPADWRRMVYQSKPRMQLDDTFGQFDCPDAGQITPKRTSSITALQALNLLNSRFIVQQASLFASRLEREAGPDANAQIRRAYSLTFLRPPTDDEQSAATQFVKDHGLPAFCRALLNANEFLFVF